MWPGLVPAWTFPVARSMMCLYRAHSCVAGFQDIPAYFNSRAVILPLRFEPVIATNSYENKNSYTMSANINPVMFISTIARIRLKIR
jgi:hypothetical protein